MRLHTHNLKAAAQLIAMLSVLLSSLALLAGCGGDGTSTTTGVEGDETATGTSVARVDDTVRDATATGAEAGPSIESIRDDVSRIRSLPVRSELDVSYITREQLAEEIEAEMQDSYPADELAVEERVLKGLGLLDEEQDLQDVAQEMLTGGVLGYYDDETAELKVISDTEEIDALNEVTLAHEITHALQDQSFSLQQLLPDDGSSNDDRDLAVLSLIEGDATVTDQEYAASKMGFADAVSLLMATMGAPAGFGSSYLDDSLSFPYLEGSAFVSYLKSEGGWEAVDGVYSRPPESTEQIMHPRKYLEAEAPVDVMTPDLAAVLGAGWQRSYENVIGEFDALQVLEVGLPYARASRAAAGWGGGSIDYYDDGSGGELLSLVLVWDTASEADEFTLAMADNLESQTESAFVFQEGRLPYLEAGFESWVMVQRGRTTVIISAPDAEMGERAARLILNL